MKLIKAEIHNFGSYRHLEFFYEGLGLTLVYGATGSGKSTLADIAPWILYGVTAKDGNADDVRSWFSPHEPTTGTLTLDLPSSKTLTITRIRGKANQNDLYWGYSNRDASDHSGNIHRGKDLADSQRRLNEILGCDADTFGTAAYVSEFSPTGSFFRAGAKDRRKLLERLADTTIAARLQDRSAAARKDAKSSAAKHEVDEKVLQSSIVGTEAYLTRLAEQSETWITDKAKRLNELGTKSINFEVDKAVSLQAASKKSKQWESALLTLVSNLREEESALLDRMQAIPDHSEHICLIHEQIGRLRSTKCTECGGPKRSSEIDSLKEQKTALEAAQADKARLGAEVRQINAQITRDNSSVNPYSASVAQLTSSENHYAEQIAELEDEQDPYAPNIDICQTELNNYQGSLLATTAAKNSAIASYASYTALLDLAPVLRGELIRKVGGEVEGATNALLEMYFDAEIRVEFYLDGDALDVTIGKSAYEAAYSQLSKGQRAQLKLCFSVAVMEAAANKAGMHFSCLAFDEALDGFSSDLKIKAYALFEALSEEHEAILVIDHDTGLHQMFPNKLLVELHGDESEIHEE